MKRLKKNILILFMLLVAVVLGGSVEIPHERITENPEVEATTVESKKIKENAKLNISVNKKNIEEITGYEINGKMVFVLPEEKTKMIKDEEAIVVKSLSELPNTYQGPKKNRMAPSKRFPVTKDEKREERIVTVEKQEGEEEYYVALVEKSSGAINKVFKAKTKATGGDSRLGLDPVELGPGLFYDKSSGTIVINQRLNGPANPSNTSYIKRIPIWDIGSRESTLNVYKINQVTTQNLVLQKSGFFSPATSYLDVVANLTYWYKFNPRDPFPASYIYDGDNPSAVQEDVTRYILPNTSQFSTRGINKSSTYDSYLGTNFNFSMSSIDTDGGVYTNPSFLFNIRSYTGGISSGDLEEFNHNPVNKIYYVVPRDPRTANISLNLGDVGGITNAGRMSLGHAKFGGVLGYQRDHVEYLMKNAGNSGITISGTDLIIPKNGRYTIVIERKSKIPGYPSYLISEDTINLNLVDIAARVVDIGELTFQIDPRLSSMFSWIDATGKVGHNLQSSLSGNYKKMMEITPNLKNLPSSSVSVRSVLSIEGRPDGPKVNGEYRSFYTQPNVYENEAAIKAGVPISNFSTDATVSVFNGSSPLLDNKFLLDGTDNKFYSGNIKETYGPNKYYVGVATATLDLSAWGTTLDDYSQWAPGGTGNVPHTAGKPLVLPLGTTKLMDTRGISGANSIATKLVVKQNGVSRESTAIINGKMEVRFPENTIGISINTSSGDVYVTKNDDSTATNAYEVVAYYNDVVLGKLNVSVKNSTPVDIGEIEFELDPRIQRSGVRWIDGVGRVGTSLLNPLSGDYKKMMRITPTLNNLPSSVSVQNVLSIQGRPAGPNVTGEYRSFYTSPNVYENEAAIKVGVPINNFSTDATVSVFNGASPLPDNRFGLTGSDGKFYSGNIKERYRPDKYYEGIATLDMSSYPNSSKATWSQKGGTGSIIATSGVGAKLELGSTNLFDIASVFNTNSIATKLVVNNGAEDKFATITNGVGEVTFPEYTFGFEGSQGNFYIKKNKSSPVAKTYELTAYYGEIPLGKLTVTIAADPVTDIGTIDITIDSRLGNNNYGWFNGLGGISYNHTEWNFGITKSERKFPEFIKIGTALVNFPSPVKLEGWGTLPGRTRLRDGGGRTVYGKKGGSGDDGLVIAYGLYNATSTAIKNVAEFLENGVFLREDITQGNTITDKLTYEGEDGKLYSLKITQNLEEKPISIGSAEIDLTDMVVGTEYEFQSTIGIGETTDREAKLKLISGQLPQLSGINGNKNIANQIWYNSFGNILISQGTEAVNSNWNIKFDKDTGNLKITKLKEDAGYNGGLPIKLYYAPISENGSLGANAELISEFNLFLKNTSKINVGEMTFKVDQRLLQLRGATNGWSWITGLGDIMAGEAVTQIENYSELIDTTTDPFDNLSSVTITDVVKIEGRPNKTGKGIYKTFSVTLGSNTDEAGMPFNKNLSNLNKEVIVSRHNGSDPDMLNNRFTLLGSNNVLYYGNTKEVYDTSFGGVEAGYKGEAEIDITRVRRGKLLTFPRVSGVGSITSGDAVLNLTSGNLPQTQGYRKDNIVTGLKVSSNSGALTEISQAFYETDDYKIQFNNTTGDLEIIKKSVKSITDELLIEYYHKKVKLGEFKLEINNTQQVTIVGSDELNFGEIIQGRKTKIDGQIKIKSTTKIVTVEIDSDPARKKEIKHKTSGAVLPYTAEVSAYSQGTEIPVGIKMELDPSPTQELGDYTGELSLIVTIE
ncbi:MAG: hypothetical protein ACRC0S_00105 [Fusobacteriaceae bacterium]